MARLTVRSRKLARSYVEVVVFVVLSALCLRFFVLTPYKIPTNTMNPTLLSGDYIFVYKLPFGLSVPFYKKIGQIKNLKRGDIVLFSYSDSKSKYIKRVIGLPGDRIEYLEDKVVVNGVEMTYELLDSKDFDMVKDYQNLLFKNESMQDKKYVVIHHSKKTGQYLAPLLVPQGEVFLLGDHRDHSDDSRYWGTVPMANLEGRPLLVWLSINPETKQMRWNRFFKKVN